MVEGMDAQIWTAARGLAEINARCQEGWTVFHLSFIVETRRRGGPRLPDIMHPRPYAILGRNRRHHESEEDLARAAQEAADQGTEALRPEPEPEVGDEEAEDAEAVAETPPLPASRPKRTKPRRPMRVGAGELQTTGIR